MKLLMVIFVTSAFMGILVSVKNNVKKIHCLWIQLNQKHQRNVLIRTDSYRFFSHNARTSCNDERGQTTILFLFCCLLGLSVTWIGFSQILMIRKDVLDREKNLSCTAWLEKKSLQTNSVIDQLNFFIKKARMLELASSLSPATAQAIKAQILLLQGQQQRIALHFGLSKKNLFKECAVFNAQNLLLFQHQAYLLKRDPLWKTAQKKYQGTSIITLEKFHMYLKLQRSSRQITSLRYFQEGSALFKREKS